MLPSEHRWQVAGESTLPNSHAAGCIVTQTARPAGRIRVGSAGAVTERRTPGGGVPASATAGGAVQTVPACQWRRNWQSFRTLRAPTGNAGRGPSELSFSYEKRLILPNVA